jgi:phosphoglycerol transferase MdoB-like AlkP superfamily enzyme
MGVGVVAVLTWPKEEWQLLRARLVNFQAVERLGYGGYLVFDVVDTTKRIWRRSRLGEVDVAPYRVFLQELAARRGGVDTEKQPGKHVIYLQLESLDGLMVGGRKNGERVMPVLEDLARKGVYFTNAIDNTASGRTTDGEFLVLTSQVPLPRPPVFVTQHLEKIPSMPRVLGQAGYRTVSLHGFNGVFWQRGKAHQALGYDEMIFEDQLNLDERIGWGYSDRAILAEAAEMVVASEQPLFLHVITLTNHHPYDYISKIRGETPGQIEAEYLKSVKYLDDCIGAFFADLEAGGVLEDCLVVIYGDHDSAIDDGLLPYLDSALPRLIPDTVPMVMVGFDRPNQRVDALSGLQDLPVMVLQELGLPVPLTFVGNGWNQWGRTSGAAHGAWQMAGEEIVPWALPIDAEILTRLAINYPEKLQEP